MKDELCSRRKGHGGKLWELLGGVALVVVVAGIIVNFADIKRYIQISRM